MGMAESYIQGGETCWLCGEPDARLTILVERETPSGPPCDEKSVYVHHGCFMDMRA